MKVVELSQENQTKLAVALSDCMMGGNELGHAGLLNYVLEDYGITEPVDWQAALEFCQSRGIDIDECPECGWVSEGNWYDHPQHQDGVCSDCEYHDDE